MVQAAYGAQELADLFRAQYDGKRLRLATGWDNLLNVPSSVEGDVVEKADRGHCYQYGTRRQVLVPREIQLIGSDLWRAQQIWRLAEMAGKLGNLLQVRSLCMKCEVPNLHFLNHDVAKWRH